MLTSLLFEFVCSYESDNIYQNIDGFLQVRFEKHLGCLQDTENISIGFNGAQNSVKTWLFRRPEIAHVKIESVNSSFET